MNLALPSSRRASRLGLALGLAGAGGVLLLALVPLALALWAGPGQAARVERVVRANFPEFCSDWRDAIHIAPNPVSALALWDVSCVGGMTGAGAAVMSISVARCEVRAPVRATWDWRHWYRGLVGPGQRLAVCP